MRLLIGKTLSGSRLFQNKTYLTVAAESRRAAVSQTVKVKAETKPVPENTTSSGSRSTWLNKPPKKRSKKVKTRRGRKTGGGEKKREREKKQNKTARCSKLLFTAIWKELSSGVDFFFVRELREKPLQSTKLRNVKLPACVFFYQAPGFPINPCSTVQWYVTVDYCYYCFQIVVMIPSCDTTSFFKFQQRCHVLPTSEVNADHKRKDRAKLGTDSH